eukprot:RCo043882
MVRGGHVDVINEVDQLLSARRSVLAAGLLVKALLHDRLQGLAVRAGVEVDDAVDHLTALQLVQPLLDNPGLSRSRCADEQDRLLVDDEQVHQVGQPNCVRGLHVDLRELQVLTVLELWHDRGPRHELLGLRVDVIVKHAARLGDLHAGELPLPPDVEQSAEVRATVRGQGAPKGPDQREHEVLLVQVRGRTRREVLLRQQPVQQAGQRLNKVQVHDGHNGLHGLLVVVEHRGDILVEEHVEVVALLGVSALSDPLVLEGPPPHVGLVYVQDPGAAHGGRGGVAEVADLEHQAHRGGQRNTLVAGQGEHLVVIHHRVHRLNPLGVDNAVQDDPLAVLLGLRQLGKVSEDPAEEPVLPLASLLVDVPVQLVGGDGLGVDDLGDRLVPLQGEPRSQGAPQAGLARACGPDDEHGVPYVQQLLVLHRLGDEDIVLAWQEPELRRGLLARRHQLRVHLHRDLHVRKQRLDELHEDVHVILGELRHVGVSQGSHQGPALVDVGVRALQLPSNHQHGLHGAQPPVVVVLRREQLLVQAVQRDELLGEILGLQETLRAEHDLTDVHQVRHHHGAGPEQRLDVLRELRAALVPWVHRDEHPDRGDQADVLTHETEPLLVVLNGIEHGLHLSGHHGQHLNRDTVELIEAPPRARHGEPLEDIAQGLVVHLVRTVEDVAGQPQRAGQVLGGLRLARTGGPGGSATLA